MTDLPLAARFTELGLIPHEEAAMRAFYTEVLGLVPVSDTEIPVGVNRRYAHAGITIKLLCLKKPPPAPVRGLSRAPGLRLLTLLGDAAWYEDRLARLAAAGIDTSRAVETEAARALFIRDPDGNAVELATMKRPEEAGPAVQIGIAAHDPEAVARFYERFFGARYIGHFPYPDGHSNEKVDWGPVRLNIWGLPDSVAAPEPGERHSARAGIRYLTAAVPSVPEAVDRLAADGVSVPMPTMEWRGIAHIAFIADPSGANTELTSRLAAPTAARA
ncbi:MAG: hypothetical protein HXY25_06720 [Alphaproteobacteria bacterium]|nr:hypothetical protein [Alphaproteobacteria bacterium]